MITVRGENYFFDYFSGRLPRWAGRMAVGIGDAPATSADEELEYHVSDAKIDIIVPDFYQKLVVIRGVLPVSLTAEIKEIGVYFEPTPSTYKSIARFDPAVEQFEGGVQVFEGRLGSSSILVQDGDVIKYASFPLLLGNMAANDEFRIALNKTAGSASIKIDFILDDNNMYTHTMGLGTDAGYGIVRAEKRVFSPIGFPDWQSIQQLHFTIEADPGVEVRLEDMRSGRRDSAQKLLAREVLESGIKTQSGQETEIEYKVGINFGN